MGALQSCWRQSSEKWSEVQRDGHSKQCEGVQSSCRVLGEGVGDVQVPQKDMGSSWLLWPEHRRTLLLKGSTEEKKELN